MYFTFEIRNLSRVAETQLVRHRLASYNVLSHRKSDESLDNVESYIIPPIDYLSDEDIQELVIPTMKEAFEDAIRSYKALLQIGVRPEDARYVLPQAQYKHMIMSCNLRELRHIISMRATPAAQAEIRHIALQMYETLREINKVLVYGLTNIEMTPLFKEEDEK